MKIIIKISVLLIVLFLLVNCSKDYPIIKYTLTTTIYPTNGGTVTPSIGTFESGKKIIMTSTPSKHYKFKNYSGGYSGTENPITVTVDSNKSIDIYFELNDTDGDGVTDDKDTCPNTPTGQTVDSNGCSESEYIKIPDYVFGDVLTRLGYPVIEGKMKPYDALRIERFIITSKRGFYGEPDSNGTTIWRGIKVAYTEGEYIKNTSGLEYFHNLKEVRIEFQHFTKINLSTLKNLNMISLWGNPILELDISNNIELTSLGLSETGLTNIDISKLYKLEEAAFQLSRKVPYNITTGNKTFTVNGFSSLNFSENIRLQRIYVDYNPINKLGIGDTNKNSLTDIWANGTNIDFVNLSGFKKVSYVILSDSKNLEYLNLCGINNGNVAFRLYCESCPSLKEIKVNNVTGYQNKLNTGNSGVFIDSHISFVNCD